MNFSFEIFNPVRFSKHMFDSVIIRAATGSLTRGVFIWRVLIESPEARNESSKYHKHKLAASEEVTVPVVFDGEKRKRKVASVEEPSCRKSRRKLFGESSNESCDYDEDVMFEAHYCQ